MDAGTRGSAGAVLYGVAALGGLVAAVIVILNLHILAGLDQGYAATPRDVWEQSTVLGLADVVLLVGGPALGLVVAAKTRRRARAGPPT